MVSSPMLGAVGAPPIPSLVSTTHTPPMRLFTFGFAVFSLAATALSQTTASFTPEPSDRALPARAIPDRYIVKLQAGVNPRAVAPAHGVTPDFVYQRAVNGRTSGFRSI